MGIPGPMGAPGPTKRVEQEPGSWGSRISMSSSIRAPTLICYILEFYGELHLKTGFLSLKCLKTSGLNSVKDPFHF